ncbi:MAG: copper homeostasis protein CutC [Defluviitaleaceae bacterium]|nr:copper homeostasis protein CutC [Defluviitaleaceae bacterium]
MKRITMEICCGSYEDVVIAEAAGADRVELNSSLFQGGLTPTLGCLIEVKKNTTVPIIAMVRPREAGFFYSKYEYEVMKRDAKLFIEHGADGLVFGFLNPDGTFDKARMKEFTDICHAAGKEAVCHRAFDVTPDPFAALDTLIELKVNRVLTSGQQPSVITGTKLVAELVKYATGRIEILPGAGLDSSNIADFVEKTGVDQVHFAATTLRAETSTAINPSIYFGGALYPREDVITIASGDAIKLTASAIGR